MRKNIFAILVLFFYLNCQVDIRQIPPIRNEFRNPSQETNRHLFRKFDIILVKMENFENSWKESLSNIIRSNNQSISTLNIQEIKIINETDYILDLHIFPKLKDDYNYWLTWPAIYPLTGYWPLQVRKAEYSIELTYKLSKDHVLLKQNTIIKKSNQTTIFYGFFRTSDIEMNIEATNKEAMEQCAEEIVKLF